MINTHSLCANPERGRHTKGVLSAGNQICQRTCSVGTEGYINPPASGALGYPADTKDCGKNYEYKSVNAWHFFLLCTANIQKLSIMAIFFAMSFKKAVFSKVSCCMYSLSRCNPVSPFPVPFLPSSATCSPVHHLFLSSS